MMRRTLLALLSGGLLLCSCATGDSKTFVLTTEGVGSLRVGQPFTNQSASGEGLYNRVDAATYPGFDGDELTVYDLYLDEEPVATFYTTGYAPVIHKLRILTPRVVTKQGAHVGMTVQELFALDGVQAVAQEDLMGDTDCGYTVALFRRYGADTFNGDYFTLAPAVPACLTAAGQAAAGRAGVEADSVPLSAADFTADAVVAEIYCYDSQLWD